MPRGALVQPGVETGESHSPLEVPCKKIAPLTSCAFLRDAGLVRLHKADVDKLLEGRADALIVLAVRA